MSYTEMEYRYALEKSKPIIAFLHEHPENIPAKNIEKEPEGREKLDQFRNLVKGKLCRLWNTASELGSVVSRSIVQLKKQSPAIGWIRADTVPDNSTVQEILRLRQHIEELWGKLHDVTHKSPPGTENLSQGEDTVVLLFSYGVSSTGLNREVKITWN